MATNDEEGVLEAAVSWFLDRKHPADTTQEHADKALAYKGYERDPTRNLERRVAQYLEGIR